MSNGAADTARPGVLTAIRAFGVMLGGSLVLLLIAAASFGWAAVDLLGGRLPPWPVIAVLAGTLVYLTAGRSWMRGWGASRDERTRALPGDADGIEPAKASTRAVTIDAAAEEVWPWIAQIGQDRGGFYSYEWLENLAGCRMRNADRVHPEWQHRELGEKVLLHPAVGLELTRFEPGRVLTLANWGSWVLEPAGEGRTRLIARGRSLHGAEAAYYLLLLELPHFLMERKMLLGIRQRVEAARG